VTYDEVSQRLAGVHDAPLTTGDAGRLLYDMVAQPDIENVLELGFAQGTSTAYMAAALAEKGAGSVTTIDRAAALSRKPNIHQVFEHLGLDGYLRPLYSSSSYNWELMRLIERQTSGGETIPCFDFCFIDGAHTWETDGLAFVLADKLLRHDRWVLFDDLHWTIASSPSTKTEKFETLSADELSTPQIAKVFDLLVRNHPGYGEFRVTGRYGWAYKSAIDGNGRHQHDVEQVVGPLILCQVRARRHPPTATGEQTPLGN
jgi:predicted O-methyltransferase YrrM